MNLSPPAAGLRQVYFPEGPEYRGSRTKEGGAPCQSSLSRPFFPQSPPLSPTRKKKKILIHLLLCRGQPEPVRGRGGRGMWGSKAREWPTHSQTKEIIHSSLLCLESWASPSCQSSGQPPWKAAGWFQETGEGRMENKGTKREGVWGCMNGRRVRFKKPLRNTGRRGNSGVRGRSQKYPVYRAPRCL